MLQEVDPVMENVQSNSIPESFRDVSVLISGGTGFMGKEVDPVMENVQSNSIPESFRDVSVLISGGTGFMGKEVDPVMENVQSNSIPESFRDVSVLISGGTGFMGKEVDPVMENVQSNSIPESFRDVSVLISGGTGFMGKEIDPVMENVQSNSIPESFRDVSVLISGGTGFMEKEVDPVMENVQSNSIPESFRDVSVLISGGTGFMGKEVDPVMENVQSNSIPESFRDVSVLISGGTGFMGKVLTEKLLRSCPDMRHLYLLIRGKRGKNMHQRLDEIFQDPLFSVLESEQPKYRHKVTGIDCDMSASGLALSQHDRQLLAQEVSVVFHGAATVRFDEKLRTAYNINVRGTQEMLALAKDMTNLKAFVHVSTAYANCHLETIDEKLYETPMEPDRLQQIVENIDDDKLLEVILPKLLGKWPNTYAFTKAMAEHVVNEYTKTLPVTIFRPAIVVGTAYEPLIGWTDNVYGPTGIVVGAGCGVVHTIYANTDCVANIVPVDMTVNALIASAWQTINESQNNQAPDKLKTSTTVEPKIYNYVSSVENPLKWGDFKRLIELHGTSVPPMRAMWYYFLTIHRFWFTHLICTYFLHYLPALIIDGLCRLTGKESPNLFQVYRKIDKFSTVLAYFAHRSWHFSNDNVQKLWGSLSLSDQQTFNFDMKQLDWDKFFYNYIRGLRVYLLKDDMSTLPQAMVRWRRFYWAHQTLKALFGFLVLRVGWACGSILYNVFN